MEKEIKNKANLSLNFIVAILLFSGLIISLFASSFNFFKADKIAESMISQNEEASRPANLQITIIKDSSCLDCFDINLGIEEIKKANVNIEEEKTLERTDANAEELISKFGIEKLPAFIINGEINKNSSLTEVWPKIGEVKDGSVVFKSAGAPYIQASTGEKRGAVKLIIISSENCADCFDVEKYKGLPNQMRMYVEEEKTIEYKSSEGEEVIKKYDIDIIPTIVISGDLEAYSVEDLKKFGEIKDNTFILTQLQPPYIKASSEKLMGKIDVTVVSDENCSDCYDIAAYDNIIKQFGLFVQNKKTVDANSANGKALIKKYKIEAVPTMIMIGDVEVYNKPGTVWDGIGTMENDGAYVLRENGIKQLGAYKNLISEEIIKPENGN
jgi:hypothetical protein